MFKEIKLSGKFSEYKTLVDEEDYIKFGKMKWLLAGKGYVSKQIYIGEKGKVREHAKTIYLHRLIMNCPDGQYVDHINNDRLDNRKSNLRLCNNSQNNARKFRINKSTKLPYIGVYKSEINNSFRFQVKNGDICINGRGYKTSEEAQEYYKIIHKLLFKEFSPY